MPMGPKCSIRTLEHDRNYTSLWAITTAIQVQQSGYPQFNLDANGTIVCGPSNPADPKSVPSCIDLRKVPPDLRQPLACVDLAGQGSRQPSTVCFFGSTPSVALNNCQ